MAVKHNPENERRKRAYLTYMREAQQHGEQSLDSIAKAIHRFETYTKFRSFKAFRIEQGIAFKAHLAVSRNERTGSPLTDSRSKRERLANWLPCPLIQTFQLVECGK